MKLRRDRLGRLMACSLTVVAIAYGQVASAQETKIEGLITSRNGAQMTVKAATGDFVITLTDDTEVKEKEGRLGLRKKQAAVMGLIPGLKVDVHGMTAPKGGLTATSVTLQREGSPGRTGHTGGAESHPAAAGSHDRSGGREQGGHSGQPATDREGRRRRGGSGQAVRRARRLRRQARSDCALRRWERDRVRDRQEGSRHAGQTGEGARGLPPRS